MKALGKGSIASWVRIALLVAWWSLWVVAACWVLAVIAYGVVLALISNGMLDANFLTGGEGQFQIGGAEGDYDLSWDEVGGFTWPVAIPFFLIGAVAIGGSLVIVWRLRKLFESFSSGEPFQRENAQHLRVIWITMVVIELARYALAALTAVLLISSDHHGSISIELGGDRLSTWGSILILIVLAEVFREGARLKEEQELTI